IILLGAILPLGTAIEKTGLSQEVVQAGLSLIGNHGPLAALVMVYLLTALLTELMGHNPSVVLMVGIAPAWRTPCTPTRARSWWPWPSPRRLRSPRRWVIPPTPWCITPAATASPTS